MEEVLVTGGAGFIGSHLVDRLLQEYRVTVIDNLSSGKKEFVNPKAELIEADLLTDELDDYFKKKDMVFHFAANPEVRIGIVDTSVHLQQNVIVTYRVLEAMKKEKLRKIVFASTSTVYGEAPTPTPENWGPLVPISLYGASKLACEALISSYCHTFDLQAWLFRLANVIGPRSNHGVIYDFIQKLKVNPEELEILGDGKQAKSYVYIDDCINGILYGFKANEKVNIFNIGSEDQVSVVRIAEILSEELNLNPKFKFTGGDRGWKGDVPIMLLSVSELRHLGWELAFNSEGAVKATIAALKAQ